MHETSFIGYTSINCTTCLGHCNLPWIQIKTDHIYIGVYINIKKIHFLTFQSLSIMYILPYLFENLFDLVSANAQYSICLYNHLIQKINEKNENDKYIYTNIIRIWIISIILWNHHYSLEINVRGFRELPLPTNLRPYEQFAYMSWIANCHNLFYVYKCFVLFKIISFVGCGVSYFLLIV